MKTRQLGAKGPVVSALGLGCMGMSGAYGPADRTECIATIHAALDAGVVLLDTGDFYGMGHNEMLIGEALRGIRRQKAIVSVKFGSLRDPSGGRWGYDARPVAVKNFAAYSLRRLGLDHLDIYRPARLDPNVPIEDTIGAIADLIAAGHVRYVGLSKVDAETIRRATKTHAVCDLQTEYSLITRGIEDDILPACQAAGVGVTAFGVLARGLISGRWRKDIAIADELRAADPRFQGENIDNNLALVEALRKVADDKNISVTQMAIAWVAARGDAIVPLVGARRREHLNAAIAAMDVTLTHDDLRVIERIASRDSSGVS